MPDTINNTLGKHVQSGFVPGLVAGVWRKDELKIEVLGAQSFGGAPMRVNSIFRLASITKPVVAAAAMILVDDGKLKLDDPVDALLPELANIKVLKAIDAPLDAVVPARRAITLRGLLNMTFGLGAVIAYPPKYSIQLAMKEAEVAPNPKIFQHPATEYMARIGALPLLAQPGNVKFVLGNTAGWGLGGSVELGNSPLGFPAGAFGWNSGYGTTSYIDPASGTAGVLLTQRMMDSAEPPPTHVDL